MSESDIIYWASEPDPRKLAQNVTDRFAKYLRLLDRIGLIERYRSAVRRYFGNDAHGRGQSARLIGGGEQGELILAVANHFRSLIRTTKTLATSTRPSFDAMAEDDSADSAAACDLAERIWEHELDHGLEMHLDDAVERMIVAAEGGVLAAWDSMAGDIVQSGGPALGPDGQPTGEEAPPIREGEIVLETVGPWDVARDLAAPRRRARSAPWVIVRRKFHRWDLMARYPEDDAQRAIRSAPRCMLPDMEVVWRDIIQDGESDYIDILELYHDRTDALPEGRYARVVGDVMLEGGPLPYRRLPLVIKSPARYMGLEAGYTDVWDLMGLCEALDGVISNLITASDSLGDAPCGIPEGADVDERDLAGRKAFSWKWQEGMPAPQQWWTKPPDVSEGHIKVAQMLQEQLQVISNINGVVRGDPEASLKSGAALALVQAVAVQNSTPLQASAAELRRDVANLVLEIYQDFAATPRIIEVVGDEEIGTVDTFTSEKLGKFRRVRAELGNPMMRTIAGKVQLADALVDPAKFPPTPDDPPITREQYVGVMETGRLQPITKSMRSERLGIRYECEALSRGEPQPVLITDRDDLHLREHKALLDGRARSRLSPAAINAINVHIDEHGTSWMTKTLQNPGLLQAIGQPPMQMPMMPPGAPPGAANDNGAEPNAPANDNGAPPAGPPMQGDGMAAQVKQPQMPINPGTGERADVAGGMGGMQ